MTGTSKDTTIRLPAQILHGGVFGPRWTAALAVPNGLLGTRFTSTGTTQADAEPSSPNWSRQRSGCCRRVRS